MNVNGIKGLAWRATLGVAGYLGFYIYELKKNYEELEEPISQERQREVLQDVQPPKEDDRNLVAVARVKEVFGREFDWTGKPPPPPPKPRTTSSKTQKAPRVPVSDLLKVLYTWAHDTDPTDESSVAFVTYTAKLAQMNERVDLRTLRVGDKLPRPHQGVRVKEIRPTGVVFAFAAEGREDETLTSLRFDPGGKPGIVEVREGEEPRSPKRATNIQRRGGGPVWRPKETTVTGKNEYQLGTETLEEFNRDYGRILSQDIKTRQHRNPRTGEIDGVQVTSVASGSLPSQHGVSKGDVIKSINGHKVSSVNGAINYVKANADTTSKWVAVIERQGREMTLTFNSPQR